MKSIFRRGILASAFLAAALLMSGCVLGLRTNKIPVNIGFKPVIGHDTRAEAEESVPFPEDRSFKVWATDMNNGETVLNNEEVRHIAGGWLASQMWPDAELSFTAYWPVDLNPEYDRESGVVIKGFNADTDRRDLLVARVKAEYDADSLVTLNFDHILSRVDFRVMHSLEENMEVIVKKIELVGFAFQGDYNTSGDRLWTVGSKDNTHVVYDAGNGEGYRLTNDATYIGEDFFTIPQMCNADIVMTCMVRVGTGGWVTDILNVGGLKTDWQSGKQYTYTLNLTDTHLVYTTGISNWNNRDFE